MLGVHNIAIRGFKTIRQLESFALRPLNVLIGQNGAGKTNFINLFQMLESSSRLDLQSFVAEQGGPQDLLFCRGKERYNSIDVGLVFDHFSYHCKLISEVNHLVFENEGVLDGGSIDQPYVVNQGTPNMQSESCASILLKGGHYESELASRGLGTDNSVLVAAKQAMGGFRSFNFHAAGTRSHDCHKKQCSEGITLAQDGGNVLSFLWRLSIEHPLDYREIIETTKVAFPFFGGFVFHGDHLDKLEVKWYRSKDDKTLLNCHQLSSGTMHFVALTTLLLQPSELQSQVTLIDEPASGLHPWAITLLGEMLEAASDYTQLIIATQSADLISEMKPEDVIVVDLEDGVSVFNRLDSSDLADWLQDDPLGNLWKMNLFGGFY